MHLPFWTAWASTTPCLVYVVVLLTVTVVCVVLPAGSTLLTLMALSATESTMPKTVPAGFGGGGQLCATAGLISTDCATTAPSAFCGTGLTLTQPPGLTSVSAAELSSVIIVCGMKSTVAAVRLRWVSSIALPDTDRTRPSMWSFPIGGGGGAGGFGAGGGWLAAGGDGLAP